MVLFLFVVMLLNAPHEETELRRARASVAAPGSDAVRRASSRRRAGRRADLGADARRRRVGRVPVGARSARSATIGRALFTEYAFPFEVTSILILVAMVGAGGAGDQNGASRPG